MTYFDLTFWTLCSVTGENEIPDGVSWLSLLFASGITESATSSCIETYTTNTSNVFEIHDFSHSEEITCTYSFKVPHGKVNLLWSQRFRMKSLPSDLVAFGKSQHVFSCVLHLCQVVKIEFLEFNIGHHHCFNTSSSSVEIYDGPFWGSRSVSLSRGHVVHPVSKHRAQRAN